MPPRTASLVTLASVLAVGLFHPGPAAGGEEPDLDPRSLPSLVVHWECHCNAAGIAVADGTVFVQEYRRIFALSAETHELLWDRKLEGSQGVPRGPLALPGRIAAAWGQRLLLLDAATGVEIADLPFDGRLERLVGPPLAVVMIHRSEDDPRRFVDTLFRIDPESGVVLAQREVNVSDLVAVLGGPGGEPRLLAVSFGPPEANPSDREGSLLALSARDLTTIESWPGAVYHLVRNWRHPGDTFLVPVASTPEGFGVRRYDARSGELETEVLPRPREGSFLEDLDLDLQATVNPEPGEPEAIRRIDPESGEILWTTELAGRAGGWVRDGDRLFVHTRPVSRGRGLLLTLDWATGEIERTVYGLRDVTAIELWQDRLILQSGDGVIAVAADEVGPPESELRPVEAEVERILERLARSRLPWVEPGVTQDLLALGAEAMPVLAERFEALPLGSAMAVAPAFGQAGYAPAAPLLARRLASAPGPIHDPVEEIDRRSEFPFLRALGKIGGPEQVDVVGAILVDAERPTRVREQAALALGAMGGEGGLAEAVPWIDRFYEGWEAEPDDGGGTDGWWQVAREETVWWSTLGLDPPASEGGEESEAPDADGDGLPDRVEASLGTDPKTADSDGDERPDPLDPAPLGGAEPQSEEDRIRQAIVAHWAAFRSENHQVPVCVVSERPLEWSDGGAGRVLLPLAPGEEPPETCRRLDPSPATEEELAEYEARYGELAPGERLWILDESQSWSAQASFVVLRPVATRWLVRDFILWWIT